MHNVVQLLASFLLITTTSVFSKAIVDKPIEDEFKKYLLKYGYVDSFSPNTPVASSAIKVFQEYADLKVTGVLDEPTIKKMGQSRCGLADIKIKTNRKRRYVHQGTDWKPTFRRKGKMELKWTLLNSSRGMRYDTVQEVMRLAFYLWNQKTDIDFIEIPKSEVGTSGKTKEDIEILVSFVTAHHGDPYPFDGPGRTLAHAFYPLTNNGLSGDVHFDDDEEYTYKSPRGKNLLWVATHELGHSLGLEHSRNRNAVMYPWYTAYNENMKLLDDDILGIQTLYGSRTKPSPSEPGNPVTTPKPDKGQCPREGKITAVYYSDIYKQEFAFTENHKIHFLGYKDRIPTVDRFSYYPKVIVPGTIEALFTLEGFQRFGYNKDKYQFIFNDQGKYFMYHGFSRAAKHERNGYSIYDGQGPLKLRFPSYVRKIDAVFNAVFNGRTYFFAGTEYWRYDNSNRRFDAGYPKNIKRYWGGLPSTVDAAYSSPDKSVTYFLAEGKYYLYDDKNIKVKSVHGINNFLNCGGAGSIIDNSPPKGDTGLVGLIGSLSIGSIKQKPVLSIGSIAAEP